MEQIYSIPVNEAFDNSAEEHGGCPFCALYRMLEENELDAILGASMMEPDIRIRTNEEGFCHRHYKKMLGRKKILPMALTMESHLAEVSKLLGGEGFRKAPSLSALGKLEGNCYVCNRIGKNFSAMIATSTYLFETEPTFAAKTKNVPFFCLPHYRAWTEYAQKRMDKRHFRDFSEAVDGIERAYIKTLSDDVSWFCKKFDYRFDAEPWYNSKDSVPRAVLFLSGTMDADNEED